MSMVDRSADRIHLQMLDEPIEMQVGLREALLSGTDRRDGFTSDICIGVFLWERWRPALEPAGMDREAFVDVVTGYSRELWLWLLGERRWEPFIEGLAGRVRRRLPDR